jgi:hypothetical protein
MGRIYSPNTKLLRRGRGHFIFKETGAAGFQHLGNVPGFSVALEVTEDPHYSSMASERLMDANEVTEKAATGEATLEEMGADNLNLALLGDGVISGSQSAGYLDGVEVTPGNELFVQIDATLRYGLNYTKLSHGAVTSGPFVAGDTVTGGTSAATAVIAWVGTGFIEVVNVSGTFTAGETITGTTSESATLSGVENVDGAVVVDDATSPTTRYTEGTDYRILPDAGHIAAIDGGSISGAVDVSADYGAKTTSAVRALVDAQKEGELRYVGTNATGPKYYMEFWKAQLVGGSFELISEDRGQIPLSMKFLADTDNHPNEPFFRSTIIN